MLGAVSVATGCVMPGTVAADLSAARAKDGARVQIMVEHPTGEFTVDIGTRVVNGAVSVERPALLRTARALFEGHVLVPRAVWDGTRRVAPMRVAA